MSKNSEKHPVSKRRRDDDSSSDSDSDADFADPSNHPEVCRTHRLFKELKNVAKGDQVWCDIFENLKSQQRNMTVPNPTFGYLPFYAICSDEWTSDMVLQSKMFADLVEGIIYKIQAEVRLREYARKFIEERDAVMKELEELRAKAVRD